MFGYLLGQLADLFHPPDAVTRLICFESDRPHSQRCNVWYAE